MATTPRPAPSRERRRATSVLGTVILLVRIASLGLAAWLFFSGVNEDNLLVALLGVAVLGGVAADVTQDATL